MDEELSCKNLLKVDRITVVQYILCSAIWYKELPTMHHLPRNCDKGIVLCGRGHCNIIAQMSATMNKRTSSRGEKATGEFEQGFLTNDNFFVGRREAAEIAYRAGQIKVKLDDLCSEDVW